MAVVTTQSDIVPPAASLRWRPPLLISALVVVALSVVVAAAYRIVVSSLERSAGERANRAARQVAAVIGPLTTQLPAALQRTLPTVASVLVDPTDAHRAAARDALAALTPGDTRRATIWDAAGKVVLEFPTRDAAAADGPPPPAGPPPPGLSEIQTAAHGAFADAAVAVTAAAIAPRAPKAAPASRRPTPATPT